MSLRVLPLALALALLASPAQGSDVLWIDPLGGAYENPDNWSGPMMPPGPQDVGVFDLDATYTVELGAPPANELLRLAQGDVTFDLNGAAFPFFFETGDQVGHLGLVDGVLERSLVLDSHESDFPGLLRIGQDAFLQSSLLEVGYFWDGALEIVDGGLAAADVVVLGSLQPASGTLRVDGAGSRLDVPGFLIVAYDGYGQLDVLGRGVLTTSEATIAEVSGDSVCCGVATIADAGSVWVNTGNLVVGGATFGSLSVAGGGRVTTRNGFLGLQGLLAKEFRAGDGSVAVTGAGSLLRVSEALVLGGDLGDEPPSVEPGGPGGFGMLLVADGAHATVGEQLLLWNEARVDLTGGALDVGSLSSTAAPGVLHVHFAGSVGGNGTVVGGADVEGILAPGADKGRSGVSAFLQELGYVFDSERLLRVEGDVALFPGAELRIDLAGDPDSGSGVGYDAVEATGTVELGGVLAVDVTPAVLPGLTASDEFTVLVGASGVSGAFENAPSGAAFPLVGGAGWMRAYYGAGSPFDPNSVVLTSYSTVPEPAQPLLLTVAAVALAIRRRTRDKA